MRGRRQATSSVSQKQTRMALRKRVVQDSNDIPLGNQRINGNTQEDGALDENNDECSLSLLSPLSSRDKRRRERENKSKPKEMTEEEMMDLALRLSEEEASITALRQQNEEEAMMKAIQDSMVSQTQPCSPSQNVRADEASLRISSRRKLLYLNGKVISAIDPGPSGDGSTPGTIRSPGVKRSGDEGKKTKKRRRKEGSPLLEMPDLSQTQKIDSQVSSCRSEVLDLTLDSQQSSDSTQMEDSQPQESPVFPLTVCKAKFQLPLLSQDRPQTCRTSGSQWCSQDTCTSPQKSLSAQPKSPTFPKSPQLSSDVTLFKSTASPKSPVFSETDPGGDGETEASPLFVKSLVFGRNTQHEKSPSAYKPQVGVCNSGFMSSSQESLASSVTSVTSRPKSPVFPGSPKSPQERSATCKSPVFSEIDGAETEQSGGRCKSPVFGRTGPKCGLHLQKRSASRPAAELRGSRNKGKSDASEGPSQRQDSDHNQEVRLKESSSDDADEELRETSKNPQVEPTSNMTLLWSDGDDDVTLVGSSSPVFPEEGPARQAESQPASQNQATAASPGTSGLNCRPSSSSASAAQREPISSEGVVSRPSAPPASTVHYYWGVPFCPRGLDPDDYTQVILAQMEVYEKSLKQAQRCLLRKAEWGEAILPQPEKSPSSPESPAESPQQSLPQRRKLRSKKRRDADDAPAAEAEVEEESKEEEEEREHKEEEMKNEGEEELDNDDFDVCPETQLHEEDDDGTQDLTMDTGAELGHKSQEPPEVEMILQDDSPAREELQKVEEEEMDVEVDVETEPNTPEDQKMKGNSPVRCSDAGGQHVKETLEAEEDRRDSDVEEGKHRGLPRSMSPELELAVVPQMPVTSMDCPICQGSFPVTEIEMHAAYCDGEVAVADTRRSKAEGLQASLKPRRKRTRRAEATAEDTNSASSTVGNQEKCYICQKLVPLRDYSKHTEVCIQQQRSKAAAKENLLSALEKTDSRDSEAGPSGSKLQPGDIIDLRDDDEDGSIPATSSSPIRSFTSISEATDCLIDFRKQHRTKKPSHRRR